MSNMNRKIIDIKTLEKSYKVTLDEELVEYIKMWYQPYEHLLITYNNAGSINKYIQQIVKYEDKDEALETIKVDTR